MSNIRVSPSFSVNNEKEAYVGELLQKLERTKSRFITDAVLFFLINNDNVDIQVSKKNREDVSVFIDQIGVFIDEKELNKYKINNLPNDMKNEKVKIDNAISESAVNNVPAINNVSEKSEEITSDDIAMFLDSLDGFL